MMATTRQNSHRPATHFNFISPLSCNTQSLQNIDPPMVATNTTKPPPPLTKRLLSLMTTGCNNAGNGYVEVAADNGLEENNHHDTLLEQHRRSDDGLSPHSSPADSATQAMKNDLQGLITYIDGLTFKGNGVSPRSQLLFQHVSRSSTKQNQIHDDSTVADIFLDSHHHKPCRQSQAIFRDRTNRDASPQVKAKPQLSDFAETENAAAMKDETIPPQLEPAGSPPSRETSLYFHDESLSMILSQSSDECLGEEQLKHVTKETQTPRNNSKLASNQRLLNSFQQRGILPLSSDGGGRSSTSAPASYKRNRSKTISFRPVSKDPTPSKVPMNSSQTPFAATAVTPMPSPTSLLKDLLGDSPTINVIDDDEIGYGWLVTPSKDYSCVVEDSRSREDSLSQVRKATPYPSRYRRDTSLVEDVDDEEDSLVVQDLNEVTNPTEMETPQQHQQLLTFPESLSPESARKLLHSAFDALKDARQERENARQWAQEIKASVQEWVEEQRQLIRTESSSVAAAATTASSAQVQQLESSISKLQSEIARSNSSRTDTESKLEQLLLKQEDKIYTMAQELHDMKEILENLTKDGSSQQVILRQGGTINLPSFPTTPRVNDNGRPPNSLSHKATRSKWRHQQIHETNTTGRWSVASMASSQTSRTSRKTPNGGHLIDYGNGVTKEIHPDGTTVTRFVNGDVETRFGDLTNPRNCTSGKGIVAYFHCKEAVLQITQKDGSILYEYGNGQMERHYVDGTKVVLFPDGTKTIVEGRSHDLAYSPY